MKSPQCSVSHRILLLMISCFGLAVGVGCAAPGPYSMGPADGMVELVESTAIAFEDAKKEKEGWKFLAEGGASATGGNTQTQDFDGKFEAARKWDNESVNGYARVEWGQSKEENRKTTRKRNRQTLGGKYKHDLTDKLYSYAKQDFERDEFADIKLRSETFGGLGRELYKSKKQVLNGEAGLGLSSTNYHDDEGDSSLAAELAQDWEWKINEDWKFVESAELISNLEEVDDDFRTTVMADLRTDLTDNLYLSFGLEHRYNAEPSRENNGNKLDRQDYKLMFKVGYTF